VENHNPQSIGKDCLLTGDPKWVGQLYVFRSQTGECASISRNVKHPTTFFSSSQQLNVTIFSKSNYDLNFNLYPLKAGWQPLPELHLEYNQQNEQEKRDDVQQIELVNLVKRWMPKMVFVHVSIAWRPISLGKCCANYLRALKIFQIIDSQVPTLEKWHSVRTAQFETSK
jgi:hypothetical protein